jgi:YHS domain-containing protein
MILRLLTGSGSPPRSRPSNSTPERSGGTLVRDPQCGTYIPESRAIRVGSGDRTLYFCSNACRDAYERRT